MKKSSLRTGLFILSFLISGFCALAQDTLFYRKAGSLVVIVKEVSQTEIQYKRMEMPDGPTYVINKSEISKIVYKNGYTEVLKDPVAEQQQTTSTSFEVYSPVDVNLEKITIKDTKSRSSSLIRLVERHPDPKRKPALTELAYDLRSLKRHQDGTRTGAIIFGAFAVAGGALYGALDAIGTFDYNSGVDNMIFIAPPAVFGTLAVVIGGASIAINLNLKKKRQAFVDLYNQ